MKQPDNFREERGLDGVSVDIVAEVLHIRMEAFVKVLWVGVIGHQNTNIHLIHNVLGAEPLKVLAHGSVRLSKLVGFI